MIEQDIDFLDYFRTIGVFEKQLNDFIQSLADKNKHTHVVFDNGNEMLYVPHKDDYIVDNSYTLFAGNISDEYERVSVNFSDWNVKTKSIGKSDDLFTFRNVKSITLLSPEEFNDLVCDLAIKHLLK